MKTNLILLLTVLSISVYAESYVIHSPDNNIRVEIHVEEKITYSVAYKNLSFIKPSPLSFDFAFSPRLGEYMKVIQSDMNTIDETWEPILKTHKQVRNHFNQLTLEMEEQRFPGRKLNVEFRVFDDGMAFRYLLPGLNSKPELELTSENSTFHFTNDYNAWMVDYKTYNSHQESEFFLKPLNAIQHAQLTGLPLVVEAGDSLYIGITEANLYDWSGMYLKVDKQFPDQSIRLVSDLAPLQGDPEEQIRVNIKTPHQSPWRVIMVGETPGDLIESNIILNLNEPCKIPDPEWIKPDLCVWDHWWSGDVKMNTETLKQYIDLASDMGIPYQLIDWHWYGDPFKENYEPSDNADITTVNPDVDLPEVLEYARKKDVKCWLWLNWKHADNQMEEAFALYEKWGIAGVKIDFMAADHQEMVNWYHKVVETAARHQLLLNFHGSYKPTGIRRTYPNLVTREGVLGNEYNGWATRITPDHNVTIPFTRMITGPMDYTPGGFLNRSHGQFRAGHPTQVMGTRCHELAKFVIYESPVITLCDHPDHYKNQPGTEFIELIPTIWDDSRVLKGEIGKYIIMARKNNDQWFVGGMTNSFARTERLQFDYLEDGKYEVKLWMDTKLSHEDATQLKSETFNVTPDSDIDIEMAPGGGFVAIIKPI
ncbi:MAG: hypothetical protein GVY19_13935 [Bacteroidetes bacterium]|jgi:alpha-glucosidase|nr:hypothetical protein [Bacteroidota bacterium]